MVQEDMQAKGEYISEVFLYQWHEAAICKRSIVRFPYFIIKNFYHNNEY